MKNSVFINDLHVGSYWGLWPKEDIPKRDKFSGCRYVTECFEHAVAEKMPAKIENLFLVGDLIDGKQGKSEGTGLFTTNLGEQVDAAIELLRPVAQRARRIFRLDCTPYHGGFHGALSTLDTEFRIHDKDIGQVLDVDVSGQTLNIAHHPAGGGGGGMYRETALGRQIVTSRVAAAEGLIHLPTWIVSAHLHFYAMVDDGTTVALQLPPWQLASPHALKLQRFRFRSKIGFITMAEDPLHWSGYRFTPTLYAPPKLKKISI